MTDDRQGRDKQAIDAENRQRERDLATELERGDQPEPPREDGTLGEIETALESVSFPATGSAVVAAVGDREVESATDSYSVEELVPDEERFDSPAAVTVHLLWPTVAAATKQVLEAIKTVPHAELPWSRRKAYEKTFKELNDVDADDDNEGIGAISDWIVEYSHEREQLPGSRAVRRQAATFCRENGYQVRVDEWLGI
ncbi:hypothetical protein SAMN05216226_11212 [Halovenus aranensis]|uniref:Uncharacterized protein n=1 Tax=Halovenus aranensis TaxID=890420 RepID=A0A1G8XPL4_9EURY|nr:hypothetical protein [Halovenus aranensis]SDJ92521.1 hypothetical protein SAMN05216226_11212 [Halovenus aranensis]